MTTPQQPPETEDEPVTAPAPSVDADESVQVSRRRLLAGLSTLGVLGGVGGAGTAALLSDADGVTGGLRAGSVDLAVCAERVTTGGGAPCVPERTGAVTLDLGTLRAVGDGGAALLRVTLPGGEQNGPARVWLRTNCPTDGCGLERAVQLQVRYVRDCTPERDAGLVHPEATGSLCRVLSTLADGVLLDAVPGDGYGGDPLGTAAGRAELCLLVQWRLLEPLCVPDSTRVVFELRAEATRHATDDGSPWARRQCAVDCETVTCSDCVDAKGISWVAFCTTEPEPIAADAVDFEVTGRNTAREPGRLGWSLAADAPALSRVVLKTGDGIENFSGGRSGTVTAGRGAEPLPAQTNASPCADGETGLKFEYAVVDGTESWTAETLTDGGESERPDRGASPGNGTGGGR